MGNFFGALVEWKHIPVCTRTIVIHKLHRELGIDISDIQFAVATNKCVMVDYAGESFFIRRIGDDWSPSLRKLAKLDSGLSFAGRSKLVRGG